MKPSYPLRRVSRPLSVTLKDDAKKFSVRHLLLRRLVHLRYIRGIDDPWVRNWPTRSLKILAGESSIRLAAFFIRFRNRGSPFAALMRRRGTVSIFVKRDKRERIQF